MIHLVGLAAGALLRGALARAALPLAAGWALGNIAPNPTTPAGKPYDKSLLGPDIKGGVPAVPPGIAAGPLSSLTLNILQRAKKVGRDYAGKLRDWLEEWGETAEFVYNIAERLAAMGIAPAFMAHVTQAILLFDLYAKTKGWVDPTTNMLTPQGLEAALEFLTDLVTALTFLSTVFPFLGDFTDEIVESTLENVLNNIFTDSIVQTYQMYSGRESMDDDEIRDVASEYVESNPKAVALILAQTKMNTLAAIYEWLTGVFQGNKPLVNKLGDALDVYTRNMTKVSTAVENALAETITDIAIDIRDLTLYIAEETLNTTKILDRMAQTVSTIMYRHMTYPTDEAVKQYDMEIIQRIEENVDRIEATLERVIRDTYRDTLETVKGKLAYVKDAIYKAENVLESMIKDLEDEVNEVIQDWVDRYLTPSVIGAVYLKNLRERQANLSGETQDMSLLEMEDENGTVGSTIPIEENPTGGL